MIKCKVCLMSVVVLLNLLYGSNGECVRNNPRDSGCRKQMQIVIEDVADMSVFYSLKDNHTIKDMMPRPWIAPGQALRLPFIGEPCACADLQCGCCAGIRIPNLNFDKQACANIRYDPNLFAIILDVSLNGLNTIHQVFSAQNPPAVCIPIPVGGLPIGLDFCIKLFDIYTPGVKNLHVCMDWEIRLATAPILVLHFDCVQIGYDGLAIVRPTSSSVQGAPVEETSVEPTQASGDIFDEVTEVIKISSETPLDFDTTTEMMNTTNVPLYDEVVNEIDSNI